MRRMLWAVLFGVVAVQAMAAGLWSTDCPKALESAKAANRYALLNFTGSDWCGFCMKLDKEVFDKKPFKQYAEENLVCVLLDFPNRRPLKKSLREQNAALKGKYEVGGYPTIVLLAPNGDIVTRKIGYTPGDADGYLDDLKTSVALHREKNDVPAPGALELKKPIAGAPARVGALPKTVPRDENRSLRSWKPRGRGALTASLVEEKGLFVVLRTENGSYVQIAMEVLSAEDQAYVLSLRPRTRAAVVDEEEEP